MIANPVPSEPTTPSGSAKQQDASSSPVYGDADYSPILSNWYTAKPYGFKFTPKGGTTMVMYLPISPSNLTITTHFATSVVPTLYGTVEEHSPVRYYDISIEGTTGIGPRYVAPFAEGGSAVVSQGRSRFAVQQAVDPGMLGGMFMKTLTKVDNIVSEATSLLSKPPHPPTGLQLDQTGYMAFHNLYRFLLKYKKDASGIDKNPATRPDGSHPLIFFNYKDNNQYKVVVRSMTMRRDKEDPMSYHYSISMRGYDLESAGQSPDKASGEEKTKAMLEALGLNGVDGAYLLGEIKGKVDQAKEVLASVGSGISSFGA